MTASVPGLNGIQTFLIEPLYQMRDGIPRFPSRKEGRLLIRVAVGYTENLFGSGYMAGRFTLRTTDALQPGVFIFCQGAEKFLFSSAHASTSTIA
jgi:hypothetical protein